MATFEADSRNAARRALDELIAAEPKLPSPVLPPGVSPVPIEAHLRHRRRPVAVAGVVENGLVRPLDPEVKLAEHSRVVIVAAEENAPASYAAQANGQEVA
jgi:hypothetical protein